MMFFYLFFDFFTKTIGDDREIIVLNKKTTTGANVLLDRIGWAKSYLRVGKFVDYPSRGIVQITEKGKKALMDKSLTLAELKKTLIFLLIVKQKKLKKKMRLKILIPKVLHRRI